VDGRQGVQGVDLPIIDAVDIPTRIAKRERTTGQRRSFYIVSLDGIRGIAFLDVFFAHLGLGNIIPGGFGVTVFFVLSGYLITTLLRLEYEESGKVDLKAFYLRRTFRILPLFYTVLTVAILLRWGGYLDGSFNPTSILSQALHWSNYYLIAHDEKSVIGGTIPLWSLAVEEHFYLFFPLLYLLTLQYMSKKAQAGLLWAVCLLCLVWRCVLIFGMHEPTVRTELGTDTRFDCLLWGSIMAIAANPALDSSRWFSRKRLSLLAPLAVACLLFTFLWRNEGFRYTLRFTVQSLALLPLFAYAILARGSFVFRFLNTRVMKQLGVLSYALYLIHAIVLKWFSIHIHRNGFFMGALKLGTALLIAKFLQVVVERPMQRMRKRYSRVHV
jgi:peptidoglycan/LPS O-acetylase OafA/YrhL